MWRKGNPCALLGMQIGAATVENSMEFPKKIKNGRCCPVASCQDAHNVNVRIPYF